MSDPAQRGANVAILIRLMTDDSDTAAPDPTTDSVPVEYSSISRNSPFSTEQSTEATGSLVGGAADVVGQAATLGFQSRIKGAGNGITYTSSVKPPLHSALAACGMKPLFTAAIVAALATAGSATSATLPASFPATVRALMGMPLLIGAGVGSGRAPFVIEYTAGRLATLTETFNPALDATTSVALPANWTYAGTSPSTEAARLTDQPKAVIYLYRDGVLWKYTHCRGVVDLSGNAAKRGMAQFNFTGIFAGREDAAVPTNLVTANHLAPTLVKGSGAGASSVALMKRRELSLSTWSLTNGSQVTSPEDPNTPQGFGPGEIGGRVPVLTVDPLATLVANRDTITDIGAGTTMSAVLRHGTVMGNRWAVTLPQVQLTGESDTQRGDLVGEQITGNAQKIGYDATGRDTDRIICFF